MNIIDDLHDLRRRTVDNIPVPPNILNKRFCSVAENLAIVLITEYCYESSTIIVCKDSHLSGSTPTCLTEGRL